MAMPWGRILFNTLGYAVAKKDDGKFVSPSTPVPSAETMKEAEGYFRNRFPIADSCPLNEEQIRERIGDFFWHYPFEFGNVSELVEQIGRDVDIPYFPTTRLHADAAVAAALAS